jgi:putative ABC transport system permease protein
MMGFDHTGVRHLIVGGTYSTNSLLGSYLVSLGTYDDNYATVADTAVFITTTGAQAAAKAAISTSVARFPDVTVRDQAAYKAQQASQVSQALDLVYALLGLSILIALVGIVNTLALSVIERTRELGLLRAVGTQRRQIRRMIRAETVIVRLIGTLLGVVTGVVLGVAITASVSFEGTHHVAVPAAILVATVVVSGIAGVFAAAWPARRAARLDVLGAITLA